MLKKLLASAGDTRHMSLTPGSGRSLEEDMAAHSSILGWRIQLREESGWIWSKVPQRVDTTEVTLAHTF